MGAPARLIRQGIYSPASRPQHADERARPPLRLPAQPVSVAVTPDLNPATAPLPERNASVAESDAAPILLVISDIDTNGAFVTDTEEALDAAGIHWETVRYGGNAPE